MEDKDLHSSFYEEEIKKHTEEARIKWGNTKAFKESQDRVKKMGNDGMKKVQEELNLLIKEIALNMDSGFDNNDIQKLINKHYNNLRNFYEPNLDIYSGLADMYIADERFTMYFEKYRIGLAKFMHDAIKFYCDSNKK